MNNKNEYDLTSGSALSTLLKFALPFLFASAMQAFYGAVDMFVVGQFTGTSAISAVTIGSQIMQIITSVIIGISMGTTVSIGHHMGKKKYEEAAKTVGNTILLFAGIAIILTPIMIWQADNLALLMDTPLEAMRETIEYVIICSIGIIFIAAYNAIAGILRGMGDSKTPMYFIAVACIVNILLDLLLTGFFNMGVKGVAIATTVAQGVSSITAYFYLRKKGLAFPFSKKHIVWRKKYGFSVLKIGIPIALQDTLIQLSFMAITVIANSRGLVASSAVGVVEKLIQFMFLVPTAMLSAISAITAQNIGAGKKERNKATVKYGIIITAIFGVIVCGYSQIWPETLTAIFSKDVEVIFEGAEYLRTYSIDCILVAVTFCINGYLCGLEKSLIPFIHNTLSIVIVRIPVSYLMSKMFVDSLLPMGIASPLGSLFSIIFLVVYFVLQKKSLKDNYL